MQITGLACEKMRGKRIGRRNWGRMMVVNVGKTWEGRFSRRGSWSMRRIYSAAVERVLVVKNFLFVTLWCKYGLYSRTNLGKTEE
jgi:hypothetical protein